VLVLRRGVVLAAGDPAGPLQELEIRLGGERRAVTNDIGLVGPAHMGDDVVVNLASGAVHANLTRGLAAEPVPGAAKLPYTSLQHTVRPVEETAPAGAPLTLPADAPVAVCTLHAQLAPLAWAFARAAPGARLGFVQTAGAALPGALAETVRLLQRRGLLSTHLTAGPAYGGDGDALTTAGALQHGFAERYWHAAVCAPGPGAPESGTALGHAGMVALDAAHAAAALGCRVVVCAHAGHETRMLLELALVPFLVAHDGERPRIGRHEWRRGEADLEGYAASGLPARGIEQDTAFYAAALAAGSVLAQCAA
jgi:hypothetical protein